MMPDADDEIEAFEKRQEARRHRVLVSHVSQLAEHFATVQIIVTIEDADGSTVRSVGSGNYYARLGACDAWVRHEKRS